MRKNNNEICLKCENLHIGDVVIIIYFMLNHSVTKLIRIFPKIDRLIFSSVIFYYKVRPI